MGLLNNDQIKKVTKVGVDILKDEGKSMITDIVVGWLTKVTIIILLIGASIWGINYYGSKLVAVGSETYHEIKSDLNTTKHNVIESSKKITQYTQEKVTPVIDKVKNIDPDNVVDKSITIKNNVLNYVHEIEDKINTSEHNKTDDNKSSAKEKLVNSINDFKNLFK